jgi:hypothetical protein
MGLRQAGTRLWTIASTAFGATASGRLTGRYVNRADNPVRTLSDQVGERISAAMEGRPAAEVVPLKSGAR